MKQIYSEMQKILLQEIARYAKTPKEAYLMQISEIQSELNEFKNKYNSLVEVNKKISEEKDLKINELLEELNKEKEINNSLKLKIKEEKGEKEEKEECDLNKGKDVNIEKAQTDEKDKMDEEKDNKERKKNYYPGTRRV